MKKDKLKQITFMIPVRLDSIVRLENLLMSVNYLYCHLNTNIIILQASKYDNGLVSKLLARKAECHFIEDYDIVFYRTKYLNYMAHIAQTPYLAIWDADVIIPKNQLIDAVKELEKGTDIVYPYDGHFYDTSSIIRELYLKHQDIRILQRNKIKMFMRYGDQMVGGVILVNRESYISSGMENLNFYGWGPEDGERNLRWKALGLKITRIEGCLFHLTHDRGTNSKFRSEDQRISMNKELYKLSKSNKQEILYDIKSRMDLSM